MNGILHRLEAGPILLLDGGLGSALLARGLRPGDPPDRWNLERPEEVLAVHRGYVAAGSEAIHTNTFGANRARLARFGLAERVREINAAAVRLAREAHPRFLIADIGPTGEIPPDGG
jgi:methionine synthase I (cobalamin-dependent)